MRDELRERLRRADPAALDPTASRPAPELLERVMSTARDTADRPTTDDPARPDRRPVWAAAAAVVLLAAGTGGFSALREDPTAGGGSELRLALPGGGVAASCAGFDVAFLRDMSPAFAGTVVSADGGQVVLDVDRWYAGGDAEQVVLSTPDPSTSAALDGVTFEEGERYLVTAAQGTVNGCGYSGPATPDLEAAFDEAF